MILFGCIRYPDVDADEFIIIILKTKEKRQTDMVEAAPTMINTGGPQRVAHEEEKKDDEGLPVPVARDAHVPGEPYKFDMYKMIKMGQGFVSECYLHKADDAEEFVIKKRNMVFDRLFPSMNQQVQMPGPEGIIMVTGGSSEEFKQSCYKIHREPANKAYTVTAMTNMAKKRVFHSMCYLNEKVIVVTGSRETEDGADSSAEMFNIETNTWTDLPKMEID